MMEIINESLSLVNLAFTALLGFVLAYWLCVILGALDMDAIDFDVDADMDVDMGADLDMDADAGAGSELPHHSVWHGLGKFFHIDEGPFMAVFSILILSMWTISMILNYYLNSGKSLLLGALLLIPNLIVSVFITKALTFPLYRLFKAMNKVHEPSEKSIIGMPCEVVTSTVDHRSGQCEVQTKGAPIKVNARTEGPEETLQKGETAVVVRGDSENNTYIIKKLEV